MESKNRSVIVIVVLVILIIALGGYIAYDKFLNNDATSTIEENSANEINAKKEVENIEVNSSNEINSKNKVENIENNSPDVVNTDLINNGERIGTYSIYMGTNNFGEYTLTLFSPDDKNHGFFSLVEATSMTYNAVAGGHYSIKGSNIEFYSNLSSDAEKDRFADVFSMQLSDLYQDDKALSEGYRIEYRLKLNYEDQKISNNNITFKKLY